MHTITRWEQKLGSVTATLKWNADDQEAHLTLQIYSQSYKIYGTGLRHGNLGIIFIYFYWQCFFIMNFYGYK